MKTKNIFLDWTTSVDLNKTRIIKTPSIIFICGGPISPKKDKFLSCRDIFCTYVDDNNCAFRNNIVKAEEVFKYFEHSEYQDLLSFERDLAELSILTVLFSESPGSIAELGSFSVLNPIQDRLLVVVNQDDAHQESFIWRGPILYLKKIAENNGNVDPITIYNWKKKKPRSKYFDFSDFTDAVDLSETIETIINKVPKTTAFRDNNLGHIMLLIVSILKVVKLSTLDEIFFILTTFGINRNKKEIKQYLSLLKSLSLIAFKPYRNYDFFLADQNADWLMWGYNTETAKIRDENRWSNKFVNFYKELNSPKFKAVMPPKAWHQL